MVVSEKIAEDLIDKMKLSASIVESQINASSLSKKMENVRSCFLISFLHVPMVLLLYNVDHCQSGSLVWGGQEFG